MNLRVFCVLAYGKKHESLAKNGVLALWAMSGMANSLCFYMFFSLRSSRETRFTCKNDTFGAVAIEFQVFYVLKTGG